MLFPYSVEGFSGIACVTNSKETQEKLVKQIFCNCLLEKNQ